MDPALSTSATGLVVIVIPELTVNVAAVVVALFTELVNTALY